MDMIASALRNIVAKRLDEVAEVIAGKSARSDDYQEDGIPYLRGRNIQDGQIVNPEVCLSEDLAEKYAKQLLQDGDILLTKNYGQRKIALVTETALPAIASNGLYIIRPFGVSEKYLYRYLTSKTGNAVFNAQMEAIEKGIVFPSITLSDLKQIQVPVFDDFIMQDLEQLDGMSEDERAEAAFRIIQRFDEGSSDTEQAKAAHETTEKVFSDLLSASWDSSRFTREHRLQLSQDSSLTPDYLYLLPDNTKVVIEVKRSISKAAKEWVRSIAKLLSGEEKYFYILTTGSYYEVHITKTAQSLKLLHPPTIEEIYEWERGLN